MGGVLYFQTYERNLFSITKLKLKLKLKLKNSLLFCRRQFCINPKKVLTGLKRNLFKILINIRIKVQIKIEIKVIRKNNIKIKN